MPSLGILVFAVLAATASVWHIGLFGSGTESQLTWFGALGLLACLALMLIGGALRHARTTALAEASRASETT